MRTWGEEIKYFMKIENILRTLTSNFDHNFVEIEESKSLYAMKLEKLQMKGWRNKKGGDNWNNLNVKGGGEGSSKSQEHHFSEGNKKEGAGGYKGEKGLTRRTCSVIIARALANLLMSAGQQ